MNILITSIGNKTNLIKYFRRALFNEGGGAIIGADIQAVNNARFFVDEFVISPLSDAKDYKSWLLELIKSKGISLYIPSRDGELLAASAIKARAAELGCYVAVSDQKALDICLDKRRFYQWCAEKKIATPAVIEKNDVDKDKFPVFIKPASGSGAKGTMKIDTWADWVDIQSQLNDSHVVQEFINASEYSVDICIIDGQIKSVVPRLRKLIENGESIQACIDLDGDIIRESSLLAQTLGLEGHVIAQCFKGNSNVKFIEVNARYGGGFTLGVEAGADSCRMLVQKAAGRAVNCTIDIDEGLELVRIQKDVFRGRKKPQVYCFDLDGTICSESCSYEQAVPMEGIVRRINELYESGHKIVIATARGAASGVSWKKLIESQLESWGIQYHDLVTSKPYADYYIDNKSIDVLEW